MIILVLRVDGNITAQVGLPCTIKVNHQEIIRQTHLRQLARFSKLAHLLHAWTSAGKQALKITLAERKFLSEVLTQIQQ